MAEDQEKTPQEVSLSSLAPNVGARRRRKRVGVGEGSGNGKTCGRGQKGQKSRSGGGIPRGFEGGQMPIHRRLPKVGFTSRKRVRGENVFRIVSLDRLVEYGVEAITLDELRTRGVIKKAKDRVKVLGGSELKTKLTVEAHAFSQSAKSAIEGAGGEARLIT